MSVASGVSVIAAPLPPLEAPAPDPDPTLGPPLDALELTFPVREPLLLLEPVLLLLEPVLLLLEPVLLLLEPVLLLEAVLLLLEPVLEPAIPPDPELAPLDEEPTPLDAPLEDPLDPGIEHAASTTVVLPLPLLLPLPPTTVQMPPPSQGIPTSSGGHAGPKPPELLAAASLGSMHTCSSKEVEVPSPAPLLLLPPAPVQTPPVLQARPRSAGKQ
jgi:hypothetical protein